MQSFFKQGLKGQDGDDPVARGCALAHTPLPHSVKSVADEPPIIARESSYKMDETIEKLKNAIGAANRRLIRVEAFDQTFSRPGQENKCHITIDSCEFTFFNQSLKIVIVGEGDATRAVTDNTTILQTSVKIDPRQTRFECWEKDIRSIVGQFACGP